MIIFYNLKTGKVEGTIEGRVHDESHLRMWIGDKNEVGRIVCEWKSTGEKTITMIEGKEVINIEYEPEIQKDIYNEIETKRNIKDFKVDIKTKTLERIK